MALQAKQVDIVHAQEPRICRSVGRMATGATFGFDRHMLIDKRPLFFGVTAQAAHIAAGGLANLPDARSAMNAVAVVAGNEAFIDAMVIGAAELGALIGMAGVAELRLLLNEQVLRLGRVMGTVAIDATDLVAHVRRAGRKVLRLGVPMALEATAARFLPRHAREANNLALVAASGDVFRSRPVTGLATVILFHCLKMGCEFKVVLVHILMAG